MCFRSIELCRVGRISLKQKSRDYSRLLMHVGSYSISSINALKFSTISLDRVCDYQPQTCFWLIRVLPGL